MAWLGTNDLTPRVVVAFAAPVSVSTVTPLQALVELGNAYSDLMFTVRNHSVTDRCAMYIDTSMSGVVVDGQPTNIIIEAAEEWTVTYRDVLALYFALSASGDPDAGYSAVDVSFQIAGRRRQRTLRSAGLGQ